MFDFRRITLFCLEKRLSKYKITIFFNNLGGYGPFLPPGYAYLHNLRSYGRMWPSMKIDAAVHMIMQFKIYKLCLRCIIKNTLSAV